MKRFYKEATVDQVDGGFAVFLDGRPIKTPLKSSLTLPSREVAELIAREWQDQEEEVDPGAMPMMRFGATAVDRVSTQRDAVIDEIAAFGGHDLLCYRGDDPALAAMQVKSWQPLLDWATEALNAPLVITEGITSVDQDSEALENLRKCVADCTDMQLSALHTATSISGSLIIALALVYGEIDLETAWDATTVDERFQQIKWGTDAEAEERLQERKQALADAAIFYAAC